MPGNETQYTFLATEKCTYQALIEKVPSGRLPVELHYTKTPSISSRVPST